MAGLPASAIRVRALRGVAGLSQGELEKRSAGRITREDVSKIEAGQNQATSFKTRDGLAAGLGIDLRALAEYLDGSLSLETLVRGGASAEAS